jgi:hypothetical protein
VRLFFLGISRRLWRVVTANQHPLAKTRRVGDYSIAHIGIAIDIGERLAVGVQDLEAAVLPASTVHGAGNRLIGRDYMKRAPTEADAPSPSLISYAATA